MALIQCDRCSRHVRETEGRCPFCGAVREASAEDTPLIEVSLPLSRAAIVLAGAMAFAGCERNGMGRDQSIVQPYGAPPNPPRPDVPEPAIAQPYGVPVMDPSPDVVPTDSGVAPSDSGVARDSGSRAVRQIRTTPLARPAYGIAPQLRTISAYGGSPDLGLKDDDEDKP
ncbi:MAG: hypothetical protein JNK05_05535 [Myxococcales bacterium]|nr:hypothetical protein [Myxococcales bacterium]